MSGQGIKATFGEIQHAAQQITASSKQIDDMNDQLKQQVTSVLSRWEGSAQEAYRAAQQQWDTASEDLNRVLAAIGTAVQQAGEAYQQAEQQNLNRW